MGGEWCVAISETKTRMKPWAVEVINGQALVQQDQVVSCILVVLK